MSSDQVNSQHELLFELAKTDAEAMTVLGEHPKLQAIAGFHAQQAVEKTIKAVIAKNGIVFPLIHNLSTLHEFCIEKGIDCPLNKNHLGLLNPYAVEGRYDVLVGGLTLELANQIVSAALAWAEKQLSE